jgi:tRNA 2-thiocytidine biosynthesis protein TtcA
LAEYAVYKEFPIIPCDLCGSQDGLQRQVIKTMLKEWERQHPGRIENIFAAICNVSPSQLADRKLFNFLNLYIEREEDTSRIRLVNE